MKKTDTDVLDGVIGAQNIVIDLLNGTISNQEETIAAMKRAIEALQTLLGDATNVIHLIHSLIPIDNSGKAEADAIVSEFTGLVDTVSKARIRSKGQPTDEESVPF